MFDPGDEDDGKSQMEEFEEEKDDALLGQCQSDDDDDDDDEEKDREEKEQKIVPVKRPMFKGHILRSLGTLLQRKQLEAPSKECYKPEK